MKNYLLMFIVLFFTNVYAAYDTSIDLPIASVVIEYAGNDIDEATIKIHMQNALPPPRNDHVVVVLNGVLIMQTRQIAEKVMVAKISKNLLNLSNNRIIAVWFSRWTAAPDTIKSNINPYLFYNT